MDFYFYKVFNLILQSAFSNYLLSALIPLVITGIMAIFVNRKIKEVNMLEALKSVD